MSDKQTQKQRQLTQFLAKEAKSLINQSPGSLKPAGGSTRKYISSLTLNPMGHELSQVKLSHLEPSHMLGDYNSVQLLPVLGNEINLDREGRRNFSKVELSRKDMQNFLVNGSISKEFIQSNKKELQKFIKSYSRSGSQAGLQKGYNELQSLQTQLPATDNFLSYNDSIIVDTDTRKSIDRSFETVKRKNTKFLSSTLQHSYKKSLSPKEGSVEKQPTHQAPEKGFRGETSTINNRVLETWINETLQDAQHLDIPGVILKPDYILPINRYGIDRFTMLNSGLAPDEVDRIYRCLFVYSVGFFEMLKSVLVQTEKKFSTITAIWKVFQVLLEYCCKTDYKIMMAEVSSKYQEQLEKLLQENLVRIQSYVENERVLKSNIDTMQSYQDKLEKDKQNEKQLRLKLEQEYMQNTKNHEEEVKLRLKFESKLNTLYSDHRELLIKQDRTTSDLLSAQNLNSKLEIVVKVKSDELIFERQKVTDLEFRVRELMEYKDFSQNDIRLKTQRLKLLEKEQTVIKEENEFKNYNIHDYRTEIESLRKKLDLFKTDNSLLKSELERIKILEADSHAKAKKFEAIYNDLNHQFTVSNEEKQTFKQETIQLKTVVQEQAESLAELRLKEKILRDKSLNLQTSNAQLHFDNEKKTKQHSDALGEVQTTVQQLQEINEERHKTIAALQAKTQEWLDHVKWLGEANEMIEHLREEIKRHEQTIEFYIKELQEAQDIIKQNNISSNQKLETMTKNLKEMTEYFTNSQKDLIEWKGRFLIQEELTEKSKAEVVQLNIQIQALTEEKDVYFERMQNALLKAKIFQERMEEALSNLKKADHALNQSELSRRTLEEQLRGNQIMMDELRINQFRYLAEVYEMSEQQINWAEMCNEDLCAYLQRMQEKYNAQQLERSALLKIKDRQEQLEIMIKEAGAALHQNSLQIEEKDAVLKKMKHEMKETNFKFQQQIKREEKAHNLRVNDLEQKITLDSLQFTQEKKKLMDEANKLLKELQDTKMRVRTLEVKRPGRQGTNIPTQESQSVEKRDKGTQTMKSSGKQSKQDDSRKSELQLKQHSAARDSSLGSLQESIGSVNLGNIANANESGYKGSDGRKNKTGKSNNKNIRNKISTVQQSTTHGLHVPLSKGAYDEYNESNIYDQQDISIERSSHKESAILNSGQIEETESNQPNLDSDLDDYDQDLERTETEDAEEQYGDEFQPEQEVKEDLPLTQAQKAEQKSVQQVAQFYQFKDWLLESELKLLKKVKYMVLQGLEVSQGLINQLRQKESIPVKLRQIQLTDKQHEELVQHQKYQTEKFRMELLKVVELGEDDPLTELMTDRKLIEEVKSIAQKLQPQKKADGVSDQSAYGSSVRQSMTSIKRKDSMSSQIQKQDDLIDSIFMRIKEGDPSRPSSKKHSSQPHSDEVTDEPNQVKRVHFVQDTIEGLQSQEHKPEDTSVQNIETLQLAKTKTTSDLQLIIDPRQQKKREEFANKFVQVYQNFEVRDQKIIKQMLDEQKDRLAFRAKQIAQQKRVFAPAMPTIKVGKHYIVPQRQQKENERIKHQKAFLAELQKQKEALSIKDIEREKEAQLEQQEKLVRQILEEEKRLKRMQRIVIVREDLQKKQEEEMRLHELNEMSQQQEEMKISVAERFERPMDVEETFIENEPEAMSAEQDASTQRMVILSNNGGITGNNFNEIQENVTEDLNEPAEDHPLNDNFLMISEYNAGGVAGVNRRALLKQKSENLNDPSQARQTSEDRKDQKKTSIKTLIRAAESRRI